jgi:pimeloyl-ACP methyl ester carboxylesterase
MRNEAFGRTSLCLQIIGVLLGVMGLVAYAISKFSSGRTVVIVTAVGVLGCLGMLIILAVRAKRFGPIVGRIAATLIAVVLGMYLVLFGLIYFFQDTIANEANAFFQPRGISAAAAQALVAGDVEALDWATPDGARLAGWLVKNPSAARAPLIVFFDGSGAETWKMIPYARRLAGWSVALVNYRGFSPSTGTPSQAHAFADATLIYDTLAQRSDVDPNRIVAIGYSLGTGIAVHLAAQRPVAGTILVAPYDSQSLIGLKQSPVFAPLAGIMHRYFDSLSAAPGIRSPLLCLIGAADPVIAPERSLKLVSQWGGATTVRTYAGEDHNLLLHENSSWADISAFLASVAED